MKKYIVLILSFFLIVNISQATYLSNVDEIIAGNHSGFGARQMAMGGAGIMSIDGASLFMNPANLARVPRIEISLGLTYSKYGDLSQTIPLAQGGGLEVDDNKTNSRLNQAVMTIPYPTYRGSLVIGVGVIRTSDFDRVSNIYYEEDVSGDIYFIPENLFESGSLNQWMFGFGIDLSPRLAFGTTLILYHGKHDLNLQSDLYRNNSIIEPLSQLLNYKYYGFGAKFGIAYQMNRHIGFGITAELPVTLNIEQDAVFNINDYSEFSYTEYDLKKPMMLGAGLVGRFNRINILCDVDYIDWSQMAYGGNFEMELLYNNQFTQFYSDVLRFRIGGEYNIASLGASLRAGYFIDPLPFDDIYIDKDRAGFSLGFGILIDQIMTLDFAFVRSGHTVSDLLQPVEGSVISGNFEQIEEITQNKIYLTGSYRF